MVKKMKSRTTAAKSAARNPAAALMDNQLAGAVKDSAQQIWLAGMGAFAKAQAEGGKVFEALVKEGMSLQKKTQGIAEEKLSEVTGKMTAMAGTVQAKAGQNWDKLEALFEARTAKALAKLGVPTAKDVQSLTARVDELAAAVAALSKGGAAKAAPARKARGAKAASTTASTAANGAAAPARKARARKAAAPAAEAAAQAPAKRSRRSSKAAAA